MPQHTVLVADDDTLFRESLCEVIVGFGPQAHAVASGHGAIAWLDERSCDLLLSDVDMPDMSGFTLLDRVRDRCPVALMSARADSSLDRAARDSGALALFPKPVEIAALGTLFRTLFAAPPTPPTSL